MKTLKIADLSMQVGLFCIGIGYAVFHPHDGSNFLDVYYLVGGWQLLSCIVHWLGKRNLFMHPARINYGKTILWLTGIGIACFLLLLVNVPIAIFFMGGLLIVSPFLAIWYFWICLTELKLIYKKELVHLK